MLKHRSTGAVCFAAAMASAFAAAAPLEFTPENTQVVLPEYAWRRPCPLSFAAEEMTNFLSRAFGRAVPVVRAPDPDKMSIVLGSNDWSVAVGIDTAVLPTDGFALKTRGRSLFIAGIDGKGRYPFDCVARATLNGVYEVLERYAGCRFYFPGELGEIVPRRTVMSVPPLDETCAPAWSLREVSTFRPCALYEGFPDRGTRLVNLRLRMETQKVPCCHGQWLSGLHIRFAKIHPEYFRLKPDGTRHTEYAKEKPLCRWAHVCHTSDVYEEIYQDAKSYLSGEGPEVRKMPKGIGEEGYKWGYQASSRLYYDIMPHDGMSKCCCSRCQAAYARAKDPANWANEIIWGHTAAMANRLKSEGVKGYLSQMAYVPYANVPDIDIPDNVIVTVCSGGAWTRSTLARTSEDRLQRWYAKVGKVKLYNNTGKFPGNGTMIPDIPSATPRAVAAYYNHVSPMVRGAYFSGPSDRFLYQMLNYYVFSKVAWNGHVDVDALLDEFCALMFGAGAAPMKEFLDVFERKWVKNVIGNTVETPIGEVNKAPSLFRINTEIYSPKELEPLAALADRAAAAVPAGSMEARRIALFRREYLDRQFARAKDYAESLSVEKEKARRAANPKPSLVPDFKPVTITVTADMTNQPFHAVKIPISPKKCQWYRVSYFVKGENISATGRRGGAQVVVWRNEKEDKAAGVYPNVGNDGTFDWIHQSGTFRSLRKPDGNYRPEIDLRLFLATGTVHFDGLVIEECDEVK